MNSRRMSSPNVSRRPQPDPNSYPVEASPQLFTNLQFSPDLYQYPLSGPATAPIFPQHRLFWDNDGGMQGGPPQMQQGQEHSYAGNGAAMMDPFTSPQPIHHTFASPQGFQMQGQYQMQEPNATGQNFMMTSGPPVVDGAVFPTPFVRPSPQNGRVVSEDPGMFLSSPARRFGPVPEADGSHSVPQQHLQPYFHQNEETRRERELEQSRKAPNKRSSIISNPIVKPHSGRSSPPGFDIRPGLKRSVTHTGVAGGAQGKRQSRISFADSVVDQDRSMSSTQGRSSPQKLETYTSQLGPEPRTRTSLTFVIDENGRAKAVAKVIPESAEDRMDLDASSGDSDSDLSAAEDFHIAQSRDNSFAFPDQIHRKSKLGRLKTSSSSHSKHSSYSSTDGSSRPFSAPISVHRTQRQPPQSSAAFKQPALPLSSQSRTSFGGDPPSEADTVVDGGADTGDAQHALKQLMRDRARQNVPGYPRAHRTSFAGPDAFGMSDTGSSPTTITDPDVATPSTDRGSNMSGSTRCVCNSIDNGGHLMIQW
jgi:hypothetical protein